MCGISGFLSDKKISDKIIFDTLNLMKNRGPDSKGFERFFFGDYQASFLATRLKIVDRKTRSDQPMKFGNSIIIFNGEIYNLQKLRDTLKKKIKFDTLSDTEVIFKFYQLYGVNCVKYFEGMWAFAIYDERKKIIFISRDRLGEKPLYYFLKNRKFIFGSETKFVRALNQNFDGVNNQKIYSYLRYGYKFIERDNESFFKNIHKLPSGTNLIINSNFNVRFINYWQPNLKEKKIDELKVVEKIKSNFKSNFKDVCSTDLKVGLSLSGGIDSNILLSNFKKSVGENICTYSIIDKESRYNEQDIIDESAKKLNIKNKKIYLDKNKNHLDKLKNLTIYQDKPISTITSLLQSYIYKKMSNDGIKVCITGNGADELFAGYYHHFILFYQSLKKREEKKFFYDEWTKFIKPLIRNKEYKNLNNKKLITHFSLLGEEYFKNKFEINNEIIFKKNLLRNKMLNELFFQTTPLALIDDDLNSMFYSIENRSPFLNKKLVELSFKTPVNLMMKGAYNKYLLRSSGENLIPKQIISNREKKGFNASFFSLFSFNDKNFKEWFFSNSKIFDIINRNKFLNDFDKNYKAGLLDKNEQALFNFCSTKIFLENFK